MSMTDPIADYLTRIRNAMQARHAYLDIPSSNIKRKISRILLEQGFIKKYIIIDDGKQGLIRIWLKYDREKNPIINKMVRVSKPGLRIYAEKDNLPSENGGMGVALISTSRGVMTDKAAREAGIGGEVICTVF